MTVPSGVGKHLVERLALTEDGRHLKYDVELSDPEWFTAPVMLFRALRLPSGTRTIGLAVRCGSSAPFPRRTLEFAAGVGSDFSVRLADTATQFLAQSKSRR